MNPANAMLTKTATVVAKNGIVMSAQARPIVTSTAAHAAGNGSLGPGFGGADEDGPTTLLEGAW